jgi:translation initiation factor IF-2
VHAGRGGGADEEGRRADGSVRHRPGAARGGPPRDRPACQPDGRSAPPVVRGEGAPARWAGGGVALPVCAGEPRHRAGGARVRLRVRPGAGRHPVHLLARPDGPSACRPGPARHQRRRGQGVATVVDARLLLGGSGPGAGGGGGGGRGGVCRGIRRRRWPVGRTRAGGPLADGAPPGRDGLSAHQANEGHLHGPRLRRRLSRGPAGRHRRG